MSEYFDELETRDPDEREAALMEALPRQVALARERAPGYSRLLAEIDPDAIDSREALASLPVTRKSDLIRLQSPADPLGGFNATPVRELANLYLSPGPIADPSGHGPDWWRFARAMYAAGFRRGDIVHNCFAYHFTPAGKMFESAAHALGCVVFAGGVGQSDAQAAAMAHLRPDGYVGTPDFLKVILDKAAEGGHDVSSVTKAMVSAGPLFPSLRQEYADRGVSCIQCYGTADLGLIAYESSAMEGMIVDEGVIVEIVRPGTGEPVPEGEVGEVVVTTFNRDYPLLRFATGDLSAFMPGRSPCGRTAPRIRGWMGRADQTTKVKGQFVHPEQVDRVAKRHSGVGRVRLEVTKDDSGDRMLLRCEVPEAAEGLADAIAASLQAETRLRGAVELVEPGSLANDGKVIDDRREQQ